jgi:hypothetical protein
MDFGEITKMLQSEVLKGGTPSQAGKKVIEKYGVISVVDMIHCFLDAFCVEDSDFTAAIFVWGPYGSPNGLSDFEFDRRLTPMIEKTQNNWASEIEPDEESDRPAP